FAQSDEAKGVSVSALTVFTAISLISVYAGESFERILNYTIFIDSIGLGVGMATLYRLKGEKLSIMTHAVALIFIAACLFTGVNIFLFDTNAGIYGSILFVGVMMFGYMVTKKKE
ncbi:MAG: hypothetical protein ACK5DB_06090, partial [Ignavibacteria bacterium]